MGRVHINHMNAPFPLSGLIRGSTFPLPLFLSAAGYQSYEYLTSVGMCRLMLLLLQARTGSLLTRKNGVPCPRDTEEDLAKDWTNCTKCAKR